PRRAARDNLGGEDGPARGSRPSNDSTFRGVPTMSWQRDRRPTSAVFATICAASAFVGLGLSVPVQAQAQQRAERPTLGTIERLAPRFDRLVPADARVERIAEGFDWSEGPVWDKKQGRLLFSDVPMNTVFQWQDGKGVSVFLKPSGYTGPTP